MINDYGKGLLPDNPEDQNPKRKQLLGAMEIAGAVTPTFDFNKPSGIPIPPDEDQGSSLSCTWQAFAYYFWQWTGVQLSRQDGYSYTHLPGGGGYLIDPFKTLMKNGRGAYTRDQHADPSPETEQNMTVIVNLPDQTRKVYDITFKYVSYNDIYAVAQAMVAYKGVVIGVNGNNADWANGEHPSVPKPGTVAWSHALYCRDNGFDRGQEALIAKSSWCNWIKQHYIIKDYFTSGNVFSPIVMEVKEIDPMQEKVFVVNFDGALGLLKLVDGRHFVGELVANKAEAEVVQKMYGKTLITGTDAAGNPTFAPSDIVYTTPKGQ